MKSFGYLAFVAAAWTVPGQANACVIASLLRGSSEAVPVMNEWEGSTYKTYLIRNATRDQNGILNSFIKLELIPQRWGFDLELPSGKRFAQVNKEAGKWVVSASPGYMDACAAHNVTLRGAATGKMDVYDGLTKIGSIARFPFNELF